MMRAVIISLGCTKNLVDSEKIINALSDNDVCIIDEIEQADLIIINTCGFIHDAREQAIDTIMDVLNIKKQESKVFVVGCLVQKYRKELEKEIPEIDFLYGVNATDKILSELSLQRIVNKYKRENISLTLPHLGYLKIAEGCSNRCSYCAIPDIRGDFESFKKEKIFEDLKNLLARGAKEINIIAQDTTRYGKDIYKNEKYFLANLLKDISNYDGVEWLRLLYTHPRHLDNDIIKLIAEKENICNYIDLPLQHISDNILTKMDRGVSKKQIIDLIQNIRKYPIAIRTTFIVGFPGETDKDFEELVSFIQDAAFERLGVFMYSQEPDTPAYSLDNQIGEEVKQERYDKILSLQQEISFEKNKALLGNIVDVIIDGESEEDSDFFIGRTKLDAPDIDGGVYIKKQQGINSGDIIKAKVIESFEYDLMCEIID